MLKCDECGSMVPGSMGACPRCGAPVRATEPAPTTEAGTGTSTGSVPQAPGRAQTGSAGQRSAPTSITASLGGTQRGANEAGPADGHPDAGRGQDVPGVPAIARSRWPRRRRKLTFAVGGAALVIVLVTAVLLVSDRDSDAIALTVTLEAIDARPVGAFTASTVTVSAKTAKSFAAQRRSGPAAGATVGDPSSTPSTTVARPIGSEASTPADFDPDVTVGDESGLYGSSTSKPVCDTNQLATLLHAHTATQTAWAHAMNIKPSEIRGTIRSLTPVLLARDTAATEHTFPGQQPASTQVVLQAGTAVLIDANAAPRVRCASGTPLDPAKIPAGTQTDFTGHHWSGFDPGQTIAIDPTNEPTQSLTSTDIDTGKPTTIGLGATTTLDGYLVSDDTGVSVVSFDGKTTTQVIDHPVAAVYDDGQGGLVYQELHTGAGSDTDSEYSVPRISPSTVTVYPPADADEGALWHLAAGETKPVAVVTSSDYSSTWPVIEAVGELDGHPAVVYQQTYETPVYQGGTPPSLHLVDLTDGSEKTIDPEVGSNTHGLAGVSIQDDSIFYWIGGTGSLFWHHVDSNLDESTHYCGDNTQEGTDPACQSPIGVLPDGSFLASEQLDSGYDFVVADRSIGALITRVADSTVPSCSDVCSGRRVVEDLMDMRLLVSDVDYDSDAITNSNVRLFDLTGNTSKTLPLTGVARFIRAPIIRPADAGGSGAPTR